MNHAYTFTLDSLSRERPGETYGAYCDRLEQAMDEVIRAEDNSPFGIEVLAYILMEAPADFDHGAVTPPTSRARAFLSKQNDSVKSMFREKALKLPRGRADRITFLLQN